MSESRAEFVPIAEAAQLLETTEMRVLKMLDNKELQGIKVDERWYVDRSSLENCDPAKVAEIVLPGGCGICGSGCGSGC
jgi:hypothetical protein